MFFRRIALQSFIKAHPPQRHASPAAGDLLSAYAGRLPASLIELWQRKGLGLYGARQIALIDPRRWQPILDRWVISPPDDVQRIPIALMPFGALVYYRKLTATDEDVAFVDPVSKATGTLAWSLDDFFNRVLLERASVESLVPSVPLQAAMKECGRLVAGEVYEIDPLLLSMQLLRVAKVDGAELHARLRDAVDAPVPKASEPATVGEALPAAYRSLFDITAAASGPCGLYLSSYVDWHRLLALQPDGHYRLLFWRIHHQTFERIEVRAYTGAYRVSRGGDGDQRISLDIELRDDSLGSDGNDHVLVVMQTGGDVVLLREDDLPQIATAIGGRGTLGSSEQYFRRVGLEDAFDVEPDDGRAAPPFEDLPRGLQGMVHVTPLLATIIHVDAFDASAEDDGEGTVMCTLDLGEEDGLRFNMPLYSPGASGRGLQGWIWGMAPHACRIGVRYRRDDSGDIVHGPEIGDVLTTRSPGA